ncbi:MAG: NADH-quinone oxidoreductase subunit L [Actinomycetota bacterium]|nr:NADH-quinone oxidoreductase subunit L [Actinomycetota bacterium]MDH5223545.1 NADH-quinone oxidoreductase subunit L [Actinomycetota bacterium]MDH5312944.1 NADH-quinone oxidoreductase subunit L [Actinomycetota bacterium]
MIDLIGLTIAVPLVASGVNLLIGKRLGRRSGWIATAAMAVSFIVALGALLQMFSLPAEERTQVVTVAEWIRAGAAAVSLDLRVDPLSITMALVVTGVGSLIHLYAIGYMDHDERPGRFFGYMNLFCAFMLALVLANDFLLLYLGWEGVGLCSYLLIGFWSDRPDAARAAKKAFITTRIGDVLLMLGLFVMWVHFGSFDFDVVLGHEGSLPEIAAGTATAISLLLLGGAVGKSAQLPLHVWLPDAMAGPTPVSALIHAATMVTAGVYLVVRAHALFEISDVALAVVAVVGLAGALYGGFSSLGQYDMKRALAYSTMSQLGFMFLAAGLGFYPTAIALLVAHAFYKALLFLTSGNVMHGLHDEVDVRRLGGLRHDMPWTAALFGAGALALSGLPPFSGFFTKDVILDLASRDGATWAFVLGSLGAMVSAWYIARLYFTAFIGERRYEGSAHEASALMRTPLVVLAVGALFAGIGLELTPEGTLPMFLEPVLGHVVEGDAGPSTQVLMVLAVVVTLIGIGIAWRLYRPANQERWVSFPEREPGMAGVLAHGFYIDGLYAWIVANVGLRGAAALAWFDRTVVDGAVNGVGTLATRASGLAPIWQSGKVRRYALSFMAGGVALLLYAAVKI